MKNKSSLVTGLMTVSTNQRRIRPGLNIICTQWTEVVGINIWGLKKDNCLHDLKEHTKRITDNAGLVVLFDPKLTRSGTSGSSYFNESILNWGFTRIKGVGWI
ncbi:hypothetical protein M8C21_000474 [Ambrosia artemisiifolia]|uniref:Uncharacterized protein n=1 Tax=Ambrosia artemisiifolia TaxID=4212 RepID=A0AAD5G6Z8_AMBAR|nr:hypothetical protein M8C21_000474 [Ambrosia artemisiifolia]